MIAVSWIKPLNNLDRQNTLIFKVIKEVVPFSGSFFLNTSTIIKTPCGAEEKPVNICTSTEAKSPVTRQMQVCSHTPQNTPKIQIFPTACIYTHWILHQYHPFRWYFPFPNIICIYMGVLSYSKMKLYPTPTNPSEHKQRRSAFTTTYIQYYSCSHVFPNLPLPSGPFPLFRTKSLLVFTSTVVSRGTRWSSQSSGSSAVGMPWPSTQPDRAGTSFPASPLHFQEAGFSHRPSVRTLIMWNVTQAVSSPPPSMTVAQGLQMQPELGHLPVRDYLPSLLLFLHWPKWRSHPVLSQPSLTLESVPPFTFLSPRSIVQRANPL